MLPPVGFLPFLFLPSWYCLPPDVSCVLPRVGFCVCLLHPTPPFPWPRPLILPVTTKMLVPRQAGMRWSGIGRTSMWHALGAPGSLWLKSGMAAVRPCCRTLPISVLNYNTYMPIWTAPWWIRSSDWCNNITAWHVNRPNGNPYDLPKNV